MIPDGFFDKTTLNNEEVLEYKPKHDNTLVVRRIVKEVVKPKAEPVPQEVVLEGEPQTLEFFDEVKKKSKK